ncbi:intercellular adhesion molecule 5 [Scomber scombrus]|uniref:Intercellular adhesion molecule 5 n=1 Tax=Scomber scombrus TaxID=13677 RepID=A0AAV1PIF0_SCOSC
MLGILLLTFLLCDADSTCPTELNPLSLEPPEIIEEYGASVFVNCTSTEEFHDGMKWKGDSDMEEDEIFICKELFMKDWNMEAQCQIILNKSHTCSKDLKITIYKNPEDVQVFPASSSAVEGTQYVLQCDIINVAPVQNLTVRWYKDDNIIKTDSFTNTTKTPVSESSVLTVNISRGDSGAQFRCEAQLDVGPNGPQTPVSSNYSPTVSYAPEFKDKTDIVDIYVEEGDNVTLNCEADGNPSPRFRWTNDGVDISENTNNLYINQVNTNTTYTCTASNHVGNMIKQIHVHVVKTTMATTTPKPSDPKMVDCPLTMMPAEIVVKFGDPVSINCSTSATDFELLGWEATIGGKTSEMSSLTWEVDKLEAWHTEPKCFITIDPSQCYVIPNITVYKTPDKVSVSALGYRPMVEGTEHQLTCEIINVAPVRYLTVKWYQDNEVVQTQTFNDTSLTPVNEYSTLNVTPKSNYNGAHYKCVTELHLGPNGSETFSTESAPYIADVHYKPHIQSWTRNYANVEHNISMDMVPCHVDGNPQPTVQWYNKGNLINGFEPLTRTQSGEYTAVFENSVGNISTIVDITVEYSPSFTCDDRYDVEENGKPQTTCEPEGIPAPIVTWFKDGQEEPLPQHWTRKYSGEYLLRATNKHGQANHTLDLNVLYAPEFTLGNDSMVVTLGENVTFNCSAKGNPEITIVWKYKSAENVKETTRGSTKVVNITGATSTNAGVYLCSAKNKIGTVTRSVTVTVTLTVNELPLYLPLWVPIVLGIIIISLIILYFMARKKKHGQYAFVPDKENERSEIPMNPVSNGKTNGIKV